MTDQEHEAQPDKYREALELIAQLSGQTLLGCSDYDGSHDYPHCCPDEVKRAHEIGANKAFEQAAAMAKDALAQ